MKREMKYPNIYVAMVHTLPTASSISQPLIGLNYEGSAITKKRIYTLVMDALASSSVLITMTPNCIVGDVLNFRPVFPSGRSTSLIQHLSFSSAEQTRISSVFREVSFGIDSGNDSNLLQSIIRRDWRAVKHCIPFGKLTSSGNFSNVKQRRLR
ncbi:hypothetical protein Cgig2_018011 [Carnegiea gigantea]|uniref:Uncharacterized protein n=1 Tax=Carnegiea gigantea TaxID=171969 RepID=A0A9Q1JLG8_9CARY|nr:hypothetical protein Cgig2_018011 [Carnegiea gigantea]